MHTELLTDRITVRFDSSVTSIAQSASEWLDLHEYEDVTLTLEVSELTGSNLTMFYETSPTRQENCFVPIVGGFTLQAGVRIDAAPSELACFPLARFLRWRITSPGGVGNTFDVTFRIVAACHAPGS